MTDERARPRTRRAVLAGLTAGIASAIEGGRYARAQGTTVKIRDWGGQYGGGPEKRIDVIADAAAWERAWRRVDKTPEASFVAGKHGGLFVALGQKMTGGFRVELLEASRDAGLLRVALKDVPPAPDRFVTQALADPWAIFLLETEGLPIGARWRE